MSRIPSAAIAGLVCVVGQLPAAATVPAARRPAPVEQVASITWTADATAEAQGLCRAGDDHAGRFRACHRGPLQLRSLLKDPRTGQVQELGGASGRLALVAQAPAQGSHRMSFDFSVSDLQVRNGYNGGAMTVELGCAGPGCSPTTPVTRALSTWQTEPSASYAFTANLGTPAPAFTAGGNFFLRVTITSAVDTISANSLSDSFRCDNAGYLQRKDGCVFDGVTPTLSFVRSEPAYAEVTDHIHQALTDPTATRPEQAGKQIPATLHRRYPANPRDNAAYVAGFCRRDFKDQYRPPQIQCDEYPFNASRERPQPGQQKNFSVRPVSARQNEVAGRHLNGFYADNRVLDGDPYTVTATP
jgi:hypothetical protein